MEKVGLARGDQSYSTVRKALDLISDDVHVPSDQPVVIKTNMVIPNMKLAGTPLETIRAIMDFMTEKGVKKFVVAEGTAQHGDTMAAFEEFGYYSLREKYDVELRDLNRDSYVKFEALSFNRKPVTIRLARSFLDCYLVSATPMKAHARVAATLSIKNFAIGFILNADRNLKGEDKGGFSHDIKDLHLSITRLAQTIVPRLAVVDGVIGMEGSGPKNGTAIASGVAIAGTNCLAVDLAGAKLMGFDPRTIGYLYYLSQIKSMSAEDVNVVGEELSECVTMYRPPDNYPHTLGWWVENWKDYVGGNYLDRNP